ncbi:MAG: reverse transcriptase domain-containing protein [Bacteroidota bacterium]
MGKCLGCKSLPKDHYNIYKSITNYSFINLNDLKVDHRRFDEKKLSEIRKIGKHSYFHSVKDFVESEIKAYKNHAKTKGIPHGLPISALMANIYMYEFDKEITEHLVGTSNVFYRRYSDDMIFVCDNSEVEVVDEFISKSIEDIKLEIAKDKIETIYFKATENGIESSIINDLGNFVSGPLNYLGFEFYGNKTLIKTKNIGAFYREMKESIGRKSRRVESLKSELLVDKLPIFKRKIYRLYSYKGGRPRELTINNGSGKSVRKKEYRGNFISYVFKASEIMGAPEMKKQVRNHWKILQKTIRKYEFSNLKS